MSGMHLEMKVKWRPCMAGTDVLWFLYHIASIDFVWVSSGPMAFLSRTLSCCCHISRRTVVKIARNRSTYSFLFWRKYPVLIETDLAKFLRLPTLTNYRRVHFNYVRKGFGQEVWLHWIVRPAQLMDLVRPCQVHSTISDICTPPLEPCTGSPKKAHVPMTWVILANSKGAHMCRSKALASQVCQAWRSRSI